MTEGRMVQDFIKAHKKSAQLLFEENGYRYNRCTTYTSVGTMVENSIIYTNYKGQQIVFDLMSNEFMCLDCEDLMSVDMKTLSLINYQCKELEWM